MGRSDSGDGHQGQGGSIVKWAAKTYAPKAPPAQKAAATPAVPAAPAGDGYVRKTPVQEIRVPEGYTGRIIKRVIAAVVITAIAAAVVYVLLTIVLRM